jgi:uncharacterized protein (DUF2384 family)
MQNSKLGYLLKELNNAQRTELLSALGMSQSTFYERRNNPGRFTLDEAIILANFLERLHGRPLDVYRLYSEPMEVLDKSEAA